MLPFYDSISFFGYRKHHLHTHPQLIKQQTFFLFLEQPTN